MATSLNSNPTAAGSGSNAAASSIARAPADGGGPASNGRTTPAPPSSRTCSPNANPPAHRSPQVPGWLAHASGPSVTDPASAAITRSGYSGRIVVSSSTRA